MSSSPQQPTYIIPPPSRPNWHVPALVAVLLALAGTNIYLFSQLRQLRTDHGAELSKLNDQFTAFKVDSSEAVQRSRRSVETLQSSLEAQRRAADRAVGQAKIDAQKRVEALQAQVTQEEAVQQQAITQVKQTADIATTKINDVSTDVGNVKTDVQNTKGQLQDTISNLKRATGELDTHSSLIATNAKELDALKELGERNYSEFKITRQKAPTRVADVMIELRKVDVKRNKFTIAITVDDKTVEKKDRTINEPIQFYTSKAHQPDEIVVNSVGKNLIAGYLASPKVQNGRPGSGA